MIVSIIIATCGDPAWEELAWSRAYPSALDQGACEILVHHEPDMGIAEARNAAAARAHRAADWLCFLDADDEFDPGYIRQMRWADVCGLTPALLIPAVSYVYPDGSESPAVIPNVHVPFTKLNHCVIGTLVPRDLFESVGGFSPSLGMYEDYHLFRRCHSAGAVLVYAPRAVYRAFVSEHSRNQGSVKEKVAAYAAVQRDLKRFDRALTKGAR